MAKKILYIPHRDETRGKSKRIFLCVLSLKRQMAFNKIIFPLYRDGGEKESKKRPRTEKYHFLFNFMKMFARVEVD